MSPTATGLVSSSQLSLISIYSSHGHLMFTAAKYMSMSMWYHVLVVLISFLKLSILCLTSNCCYLCLFPLVYVALITTYLCQIPFDLVLHCLKFLLFLSLVDRILAYFIKNFLKIFISSLKKVIYIIVGRLSCSSEFMSGCRMVIRTAGI